MTTRNVRGAFQDRAATDTKEEETPAEGKNVWHRADDEWTVSFYIYKYQCRIIDRLQSNSLFTEKHTFRKCVLLKHDVT